MSNSASSNLTIRDAFLMLFQDQPRIPHAPSAPLQYAWQRLCENPMRYGPYSDATDVNIRFTDADGSQHDTEIELDPDDETTRLFLASMEACARYECQDPQGQNLFAIFMRLGYLQRQYGEPSSWQIDTARLELDTRCISEAAAVPLQIQFRSSSGDALLAARRNSDLLH